MEEHQTADLTVTGSTPVLLTNPSPGYGHLVWDEFLGTGASPVVRIHALLRCAGVQWVLPFGVLPAAAKGQRDRIPSPWENRLDV